MRSFCKKILAFYSSKMSYLLARAKMTEHTFIIFIAVIIGTLAGFGAILFKNIIEFISAISFPGTGNLLDNIIHTEWYIKLIVPALGGAIVGPLIYFFAREAKGHGVPEVMQAIMLRGGMIRSRVALVKTLASAITIGTGGSVGREGGDHLIQIRIHIKSNLYGNYC